MQNLLHHLAMPQIYFEGFFDVLIRGHPISKFNGGHNILRLFDILPNFLFATSEMKRGY